MIFLVQQHSDEIKYDPKKVDCLIFIIQILNKSVMLKKLFYFVFESIISMLIVNLPDHVLFFCK